MDTPHPHHHILEKSTDTKHHHHNYHHHQQQQQKKHNQDHHQVTTTTSISPASPPSCSSSPSHEFSFTISLHSSIPTTKTTTSSSSSSSIINKLSKLNKTNNNSTIKSSPSAMVNAIDLSPADEIFFHGHLLPLHLQTISPRSSTNSLHSFSLPITDSSAPHTKQDSKASSSVESDLSRTTKPKSFSLFTKWKTTTKSSNNEEEDQGKGKRKRRARLDVMSRALKRYLRMVRPLLLWGGRRRRRQTHSSSGVLGSRNNEEILSRLKRPRQYSAPASMRTSPSNSGLLVPTASDSTMDELQAAIQAAIAHCKNSVDNADDKSRTLS